MCHSSAVGRYRITRYVMRLSGLPAGWSTVATYHYFYWRGGLPPSWPSQLWAWRPPEAFGTTPPSHARSFRTGTALPGGSWTPTADTPLGPASWLPPLLLLRWPLTYPEENPRAVPHRPRSRPWTWSRPACPAQCTRGTFYSKPASWPDSGAPGGSNTRARVSESQI